MQGNEGWWNDFNLTSVAASQGLLWLQPCVVLDLTVIDGDLAQRGPGGEEPGPESSSWATGRNCGTHRGLPMVPWNQGVMVKHEIGFFVGLARSSESSRSQVVTLNGLMRVDSTTREDPHASKGDLGVAPQHQDFKRVLTITQQKNGRRRNQVC